MASLKFLKQFQTLFYFPFSDSEPILNTTQAVKTLPSRGPAVSVSGVSPIAGISSTSNKALCVSKLDTNKTGQNDGSMIGTKATSGNSSCLLLQQKQETMKQQLLTYKIQKKNTVKNGTGSGK